MKKDFNFIPLLILGFVEAFSVVVPFYMWSIFPDLPTRFNISQGQLLNLLGVCGLTTLLSQIPSGQLADKYSCKKFLFFSLIFNSIFILVWGFIPLWGGKDLNNDGVNDSTMYMLTLYMIYATWGFSVTLIFWSQLSKLISQQSNLKNQGKAYGIEQCFDGISGFFFIYLVGFALIQINISILDVELGFLIYVVFLSLVLMSLSFFVLIFVKEIPRKQKKKYNFQTLKKVLKNYKIWLISFFIMGSYMIKTSVTKIGPYFEQNLFIDFWIVAFIGAFASYLGRAFGGPTGGYIGDKSKSYIKTSLILTTICWFMLLSVILLPGFHNDFANKSDSYQLFVKISIIIIVLTMSFLYWSICPIRFPKITEIETPVNSYATCVGVVSFVAFSTDSWLNIILGSVANNHLAPDGSGYTTQTGNQIILAIMAVISLFGIICGLILWIINKREYKKLNLTSYRRGINNKEVTITFEKSIVQQNQNLNFDYPWKRRLTMI